MNKFEKVNFKQYLSDRLANCDSEDGTDFCYNSKLEYEEYNNIKLPCRATKGSAGYDFVSPFGFILKDYETIIIPTGIKVILDEDKVLKVYPRSGLGFKYNLGLANTVGIIDCDFVNSKTDGHIMIKLTNHTSGFDILIEKGQAFAQGIIEQFFLTVDDECDVIRVGGLGSTNNNNTLEAIQD